MEEKQTPADLLLKWYRKQKAEGNMPEPTEAEKGQRRQISDTSFSVGCERKEEAET